MWDRINSWWSDNNKQRRVNPASQQRQLSFQQLESRELMASIPALSSLPGAAKTLYLDFDGDFQSVWNRTDSGQKYTNVNCGQFNIDNTAGISDAEAAAIRKIWETAADDYAPFKINVTTVAPSSFANGVSLRVVMAGDCSAKLKTSPFTSISVSGDRFIAKNDGTLVDTSGYAAINSFNNAEPNVVYVFAKYMSTWGTTDSEGKFRDLRAMIATTASHEAGHGFGLVHHGDYDVGTAITTPIMGSNTQGDRTIWSTYQSGSSTQDNVAKLTQVLGARADDFGNSSSSAPNFQFSYSPIRGYNGSAAGVISTTSDTDMFKFSVSTAETYNFNVTVPQFGNLDSQLVLYRLHNPPLAGVFYYEQIGFSDPSISSIQPFQGLGASLSMVMQPGNYAVEIRSHGSYGDLGNYVLNINHGSNVVNPGPVLTMSAATETTQPSNSQPSYQKTTNPISKTANQTRISGGAGAYMPPTTPPTDVALLAGKSSQLTEYTQAVDAIFAELANEGLKLRRHIA